MKSGHRPTPLVRGTAGRRQSRCDGRTSGTDGAWDSCFPGSNCDIGPHRFRSQKTPSHPHRRPVPGRDTGKEFPALWPRSDPCESSRYRSSPANEARIVSQPLQSEHLRAKRSPSSSDTQDKRSPTPEDRSNDALRCPRSSPASASTACSNSSRCRRLPHRQIRSPGRISTCLGNT